MIYGSRLTTKHSWVWQVILTAIYVFINVLQLLYLQYFRDLKNAMCGVCDWLGAIVTAPPPCDPLKMIIIDGWGDSECVSTLEWKLPLTVCGKALHRKHNVTAKQWFICQRVSVFELIILLCEQLQELCVACRVCQLQWCDSVLVWQADSHQTPRLTQQQLCQPIQTPSYGQVEGRLPETVLWRWGEKYNNMKNRTVGIKVRSGIWVNCWMIRLTVRGEQISRRWNVR